MKKILFSLVVTSFLFGGLTASAESVPRSGLGINPDSPFYVFKTLKENIQTFFTFGAENKAKQFLHLADVRLAEYQKMQEKGKTELAQKTLDKYEKQLSRAISKAEELKSKGKDIKDISEKLATTTAKHIKVLEDNLQKVPESAKKGIEKALENVRKIRGEEASTADETADWKTYRNEQYGFKFKYPEKFEANVWRSFFWPPKTAVVPINEDPVVKGCPDFPVGIQGATQKMIKMNNIDYTLYAAAEGAAGSSYISYCYVTKKDQKYYVIDFVIRSTNGCGHDCGPYCETQYENECRNFNLTRDVEKPIENIVSTFRFFQKDETVGWKTYTDSKIGYSFQYPQDWELSTSRLGYYINKSIEGKIYGSLSTYFIPREVFEEVNGKIIFEDYIAKLKKEYLDDSDIKDFKEEKILLGDREAVKFSFEILPRNVHSGTTMDTLVYEVHFQIDDGVFHLRGETAREKEKYYPIINKIISTFRFTESKQNVVIPTALPEIKQPFIKVISPNGGEKWVAGETHTIFWDSNNVNNVIITLQGNSRSYLIGSRTGINASLKRFDWKIDNVATYAGRDDLRITLTDAAYCGYVDESTGIECVKDELSHWDKSDNYFSIQVESGPIINSALPQSGSVGKIIEIRGKNFSGFEGDLIAVFENGDGVKGIIRGEFGSNDNLIIFKLPPSLCQEDTSYSGLPCPAYLNLIPGVYTIYVTPWGIKSNEIAFTVLP